MPPKMGKDGIGNASKSDEPAVPRQYGRLESLPPEIFNIILFQLDIIDLYALSEATRGFGLSRHARNLFEDRAVESHQLPTLPDFDLEDWSPRKDLEDYFLISVQHTGLSVSDLWRLGHRAARRVQIRRRGQAFQESCVRVTGYLIHAAALAGVIRPLDSLVKAGVDVNLPTEVGWYRPLQLAVISGNLKMVRHLIEKHNAHRFYLEKADSADQDCENKRTYDYETPLLTAVRLGHHEIVAELLRHGWDVNAPFPCIQMTPLQLATIRYLKEFNMGWAVRKKYEKMVRTLLAHGADPNLNPLQDLNRDFARLGMSRLLDWRNQVFDMQLLFRAMWTNYVPVVRRFLQAGASPQQYIEDLQDACGGIPDHDNLVRTSALQQAVLALKWPIVRLLLAYGADATVLTIRRFSIAHLMEAAVRRTDRTASPEDREDEEYLGPEFRPRIQRRPSPGLVQLIWERCGGANLLPTTTGIDVTVPGSWVFDTVTRLRNNQLTAEERAMPSEDWVLRYDAPPLSPP